MIEQSKRILIIGSNSFIGTHLAKALLSRTHEVYGISLSENINSDCLNQFYRCDINNHLEIKKIILDINPNVIFHLATNKSRSGTSLELEKQSEENINNSLNIISVSENLKSLEAFIFLGTCDEYGDATRPYEESCEEKPLNTYGASKLATTKTLLNLLRDKAFPSVIVRPSVVYGPGQKDDMLIPQMINNLLQKKEIHLSPGEQTRDFLYIDDLIDGLMQLSFSTLRGVFNIASGKTITIKDLSLLTAQLISPESSSLIKLGVMPYRKNEMMDYEVSVEKISKLLKWKPSTNLEIGLKKTISFFKK